MAPRVDVGHRVISTEHHVARRRTALVTRRHEDVHQHAPIERHDVAHAGRPRVASGRVVALVATDDRRAAAFKDADDASLDPPAFLDPFDARDDAIAVHRLVQMRTGDVDVAAARIERPLGNDEAVACRVRLQASDVKVHLLGQAESMPADLNQVAGCDQRLDVALERRCARRGEL